MIDIDNRDIKDPARSFPDAPPNFSRPVIQHIHTFAGYVSSMARAYLKPDESIKDSLENARHMRNDIMIMECLEARQRSVALLPWHIEVDGPEMPAHKALQTRMNRILRKIPRFTEYRRALLEAIWYGRQGCQHVFGWDNQPGGKRDLIIRKWLPIIGDKLVFRMDDGSASHEEDQVGIRVGPRFRMNDLVDDYGMMGGRKVVATEDGLATFLAPHERALITIHKHMIEDAAYEDPLDAGSIHGIGIRSRIYWTWFQKQSLLALLMEYMERTALGIEIWTYPEGNPQAEAAVDAVARNKIGRQNIIKVPVPVGGEGQYGVQYIEPNPAGAQALADVANTFFGHQIKRYILGQTLSSEAASTGLGSGVADLQLHTMLDILKYDATNLEETITRETLHNLLIFNDPKAAEHVDCRFVIQTESPDAEMILASYEKAWNMGCKLKESDVMEAIGAAMPEAGDPVLQKTAEGSRNPADGMGENGRPTTVPMSPLGKKLDDAFAGEAKPEQGGEAIGEKPAGAEAGAPHPMAKALMRKAQYSIDASEPEPVVDLKSRFLAAWKQPKQSETVAA